MCNKDICLYRAPEKPSLIKKTCLVLASINAIVNGLLFLASVYIEYMVHLPRIRHQNSSGIKLGGIHWIAHYKHDAIDDFIGDWFFSFLWFEMIVVALFSMATLFFSVLLCNGICKRQPEQVKAYFVYGFWVTILVAAVSALQLTFDNNPVLGIGGLCGCALHTLYLWLVHQTHKEIFQEKWFSDHLRLQEAGAIDIKQSTALFITEIKEISENEETPELKS